MTTTNTSISNFKHKFTSVKPSLFEIGFPSIIATTNNFLKTTEISSDKAKFIYIYCNAAKLPSSRIDERISSYFGRNYYEAADRTFEPLQLTFFNSNDFAIRNYFEEWMRRINKRQENMMIREGENFDYFMPVVELFQLNRRNERTKKYTFFDAFPIECSDIPLEYSATNSIEEFTVELRFQYWEEEMVGTST